MDFQTFALISIGSSPMSRALIPMMVMTQLQRAELTKSVGEKASPFPWLSMGASVMTSEFDRVCVMRVRRFPS